MSLPLVEIPLRYRKRIQSSLLSSIGNTPLVYLSYFSSSKVEIYAKIEGFNPGGSVKDRPALQMILDGIREGKLYEGKTILDSTSGNMGIALSMIGAILGFPVEICMPKNVSEERKKRIEAYGAKIIYTSPMEGSDGAIKEAKKLYEENPEKYFKPDQYNNPSNPKAHYLTTGKEIYEQTQGRITHFVATIGTSGTVMGVGRYLREKKPQVKIYAAEPEDSFHGLEGLKHMASSIVPSIYHPEELDGILPIPTEESYQLAKLLAKKEGIFAGQSSGGALLASLMLKEKLEKEGEKNACIVTVFPDSGDKYYSKGLWD